MDSQKKQTAPTEKAQRGATSSRRDVEKPAVASSAAKPDVREINPPTTTTAQNPTATTPAPTPDVIPLSQLEQLLRQIQPNLDITKALAALSQPQETTPPTPIAQPTPATPVIGMEEVAAEWFDAEAGGATPAAEQDEEEGYSGATEVLGEDNEQELGDEAGSKPIQAEELNREEEIEGRIEDVVLIQDDDEEDEVEEPRKEEAEREVVGRSEGHSENVSGATARRRRHLIDESSEEEEEEEEEVPFQPIGEPREEVFVDRTGQLDMPMERKRKGKQAAQPVKKKARQASTTVRIQEPQTERAVRPQQDEESDEDSMPPLQWERRSKRRNEGAQGRERRRQEAVAPAYKKVQVRISKYAVEQMVKFTDDKWEEECTKRVTTTKLPKSGKKLHQPSLANLGAEETFVQYITGIGFEWLMELEMPKVPQAMAKEFFTSFRFKTSVTDLDEESISFRLCNQEWRMNLTEWSVRLGLYTVEQAVDGEWFGRDVGPPKNNPDFNPQKAWRLICHESAPQFKPTVSRGIHIADPILRLAQVFLGYNVLGQANTSSSITLAELYFMWCMKEQRKVHLGYWIASTCHQIATHPARHLNVCHLLGAFVKNNLDLEIEREFTPRMCPMPELFNTKFFMNVKILKERRGRLYYYDVGQPDLQLMPLDEEKNEERNEERGKEGEKTAAPAQAGEWRKKMEEMVYALGQNALAQKELLEAQTEQLTRAVNAMEQMVSLVTEHLAPQQQETAPSTAPAQGSRRLPAIEGPRSRETDPRRTPSKDTDPKRYHRKR